jgi:mono/diheme cytochrome c family protein
VTGARRLWSALAAFVVLGVVVVGAILTWPAPAVPAVQVPSATPALIARGAYVATAADCVACHTKAGGVPYAGGRSFKLPFGTIYSPNITPDRDTGLGLWTDGEFLRAVHKGVDREGEQLYPAFPYTSYVGMSDVDALALKAYLFSLRPVHSRTPENDLIFPFNQRPLMRFWKILFMPRHGVEPRADRPPEWNRGAYLVTALGHCGECHTPRNLAYGLKSGEALSGETIQGWTAWNITPDPQHGAGAWTEADIAAYLGYGYAPGHGAANGPMKEAIDYSLSKLSPADLHAMAIYLKTVPPKDRGPALELNPVSLSASTYLGPPVGEPGANGQGRRIFEGACASCHAWNGQGQQTPIAALRGLPSVNDPKAVNVIQTVLRGSSVTAPQGHAFMPAFAAAYSNAEIAAVANYVVQHFGGRAGEVTPGDVAKARQQ